MYSINGVDDSLVCFSLIGWSLGGALESGFAAVDVELLSGHAFG